jgi:hypothetical protein
MTIDDIITYFETLAKEHIDIKHTDKNCHFFRDEDEVLEKLKSKANTPALIMGTFQSTFKMVNRDFNHEEPQMTILILDFVPIRNDKTTQHFAALERTKIIAEDIIRRIKHDATCQLHSFLKEFNTDSVRIDQVGPVFENYWGWVVDFSFVDFFDITYDESKFSN